MPNRTFNEATRVQMPALVHLARLGYTYFGKISEETAGTVYDPDTNILIEVFKKQFAKLNPEYSGNVGEILTVIRQELDYDDLGRSFYQRLTTMSSTKLIDFNHPENNSFHYTAEFTCKRDQEEFRPDITLFINGLPLVFIEVKKRDNRGGMLAESNRMNHQRFPNRKFRRFINITQLMIFSNNMEYTAEGGIVPIQGAFYCTAARDKATFNCFREENPGNDAIAPFINEYQYKTVDGEVEHKILKDFNCEVIHNLPEYRTNLDKNTPTNRILTSMCAPERILFILKYGIAYVRMEKEVDGRIESIDQKHIMRYQQMFAALAVCKKLLEGVKSGIIWHTQGSGKTALSYFLNKVLTDFYTERGAVAKFYFIVDRLDLLKQAKDEFEARGLIVKTADSREALMADFRTNQSQTGVTGASEITVVNIQRFAEDHGRIDLPSYATNLQRIFIIDEAHRGYKPEGSFLAHLFAADENSIKIALTGTPLLQEERASWRIFGNYIHAYYYDKSVQDGYTLKIIREDIETSYRERLSQIYKHLETLVQKRDVPKSAIIEDETYIRGLLRYIISDLKKFRQRRGDETLGGMIICETSTQAEKIFNLFNNIQEEMNQEDSLKSYFKPGLILYDYGDKESREKTINDFKRNMTIDILIVYNMLLTGFDAPRLKRLYLGRKLKDHSLLQAITRVNRPYSDNHYGYVIDFADIKKNFDQTNEDYLRELSRFNNPDETGPGNEKNILVQVLEDKDTLLGNLDEAAQILFDYTMNNPEEFWNEISVVDDKQKLLELRKVLLYVRDTYNIIRTFGKEELKTEIERRLDISRLPEILSVLQSRIASINQKELFNDDGTIRQLITEAMQDITFNFRKIDEEELRLISGGIELQEKWQQTIRAFLENIDPEDPEYITLHDAFMERFKEHGFVINSIEEFKQCYKDLDEIIKKLNSLKMSNNNLLRRYNDDAKFVRVHKRILEENVRRQVEGMTPVISANKVEIQRTLSFIKESIDQKVYNRNNILRQDAYFEQTVMAQISEALETSSLGSSAEDRVFIKNMVSRQYLNQYNDTYPAA